MEFSFSGVSDYHMRWCCEKGRRQISYIILTAFTIMAEEKDCMQVLASEHSDNTNP
jgi:hypothetical protein